MRITERVIIAGAAISACAMLAVASVGDERAVQSPPAVVNNGPEAVNAEPAAAAAVAETDGRRDQRQDADDGTIGVRPGSRGGDRDTSRSGRQRPEDGRRVSPGRRWAQEFERQFADDLAWLRERGLERYADRIEEARKADEAGNRVMLLTAHVRIRQLRRLWQERPEEAQRAVEELRLGLQIRDLAAAAREAEGAEQDRLKAELQQALARQFEARLAAQRSLVSAMERRLDKLREEIRRQEEVKAKIIEQRQQNLLDPEKSLPEPSLLPPPPPGGHRDASPDKQHSGGRPVADDNGTTGDRHQADSQNEAKP